MGNGTTKVSELGRRKPKINRGKKVTLDKIDKAGKTGVLALADHGLTDVPPAVLQLTNLRTLDLSNNSLFEAPGLQRLKKLKTLRLDGNKLVALEAGVAELPELRDLSARGNRLTGPAAVAVLPPSLTTLDLSGNALAAVPLALLLAPAPATAGRLPLLALLNLAGNGIETLPALQGLEALEELVLDDNLLTAIGPEVTVLRGLRRLSLRRNRIAATVFTSGSSGVRQSLCRELFEETNVEVLNLEGNRLQKEELTAMAGIGAFLERRERLKNKNLQGGAALSLSICGLD